MAATTYTPTADIIDTTATATATNISTFGIQRYPSASDYRVRNLTTLPTFDATLENPFQVDLRGADLYKLDLRSSMKDLLCAIFDNRTIWPPDDRIPEGFIPSQIMEFGKNPGLGIRALHAEGITGQNVGIAIIDQILLVDHKEYSGQIRLYEEMNFPPGLPSSMHGPAVASIAVGKTVGVAPNADLYYIAVNPTDSSSTTTNQIRNFHYLAQAVHRVLDVNKVLPNDRKIRVISMSIGWGPDETGSDDLDQAVDEAKAAGLLVVSGSANMNRQYGVKLFGLGRSPLADPDQFESYGLGVLWAGTAPDDPYLQGNIIVPMDSRTTASFTGVQDYVFFSIGGGSWTMPYLAGMYALAIQVQPTLTPENFLSLAIKTGRKISYANGDTVIVLSPVINPITLIDSLRGKLDSLS